MNRNRRREIAEQTVHIIDQGYYERSDGTPVDLSDSLEKMKRGTEDSPPERDIEIPKGSKGAPAIEVEVTRETTLEACRRLLVETERILALNFASATSPGGGFLSGASAQEESLARSSGLYASLLKSDMYDYHRERDLPMYSDYAIYSPNVPIFRHDDGELLDEPFHATFLTCAAVNIHRVEQQPLRPEEEIEEVMDRRIQRVLGIAYEKSHTHLVLGAWGCGVFGNDPEVIAELFAEALDGPFRGLFDHVVFAVYDSEGGPNISAFRQCFE